MFIRSAFFFTQMHTTSFFFMNHIINKTMLDVYTNGFEITNSDLKIALHV